MPVATATIPASIPGMIPQESVIFTTWAQTNAAKYDRFDYNVRVGQGLPPDPSLSPEIQAMAIANAQKRIDVIAWQGNKATIIEVKFRALMLTLGQVIGYRVLWLRDNPTSNLPNVLILCYAIDPDTAYVLGIELVPYVVVQANFGTLPPINPA